MNNSGVGKLFKNFIARQKLQFNKNKKQNDIYVRPGNLKFALMDLQI